MTIRVPVVENILNANDRLAEENRARLEAAGVFSINIMASPGAGKTSLIEQTLPRLKDKLRVAVVDGDIATSIDADRAAQAGAQAAIQVNTGGDCHLDAVTLRGALEQLIPACIAAWMHWSSTKLTCYLTSHLRWITSSVEWKY